MQPKNHERLQARNLYFGSDLSQQQIANLLNINRKTLHGWATEGCWRRAKYSAASAPSVLLDQYYHQLGAINMAIAERPERPWPTKEEADIIRKITTTIKQIKDGKVGISETIEVFSAFTDTLRRGDKDEQLLKSIIIPMDKHIKSFLDKGKELDFARIHYQEERDEKDYAEWLATQAAIASSEQPAPSDNTLQPETQQPSPEPDLPADRHGLPADRPVPNSQPQIPNSSADRHDSSTDRRSLLADRQRLLAERYGLPADKHDLPADRQAPEPTEDPNSQLQTPNQPADRHPDDYRDQAATATTMGSPAETQQLDDQQTPQNLSTKEEENGVSIPPTDVSGSDGNSDAKPDGNSTTIPPASANNNQPQPLQPTPSPRRPKGFRDPSRYPGRKWTS